MLSATDGQAVVADEERIQLLTGDCGGMGESSMPSEPAPRTAPPPRPEAAPARSAALRGRQAAASEPRQSRLSLRLIALLCHLCEVRQAIQHITCNTLVIRTANIVDEVETSPDPTR